MDKRKNRRLKRRIQVRFWRFDDPTPRSGFTFNISITGMFICTNQPFKPGSRIVVEVGRDGKRIELHGLVRHAARVDPLLQKIRPSGMGVRLLRTEEMMAAVLGLDERDPEEIGNEEENVAEEAQEQEDSSPGEEAEGDPDPSVYHLNFVSPTELATSFERDLKFGGIFVPTSNLPDGDEVVIEFLFDWTDLSRIRIPAHVVKRFEAAEGTAMGEKVSGIGVAFSDPEGAMAEFLTVIETPSIEQ